MLNLTKQGSLSLSADSEVLSLNSIFADNKKSHPCEGEDNNFTLMSLLPSVAMARVSADSDKAAGILGLKSKDDVLKTQSGRSMIEMLGVLAIIGVLSVGGIAGYSKAMMQYKINKTADQITQIIGNVRTLYGSQKSYGSSEISCYNGSSGNFCPVIKKAHLVPDEMWNADKTSLENAFGGGVEFASADKSASGSWSSAPSKNNAMGIVLKGLPEEACMALATYDWGSGSSSGLVAIGVNYGSPHNIVYNPAQGNDGSAVAKPNNDTVSIPMPVNIAANACKEGEVNTFTITFF